jgi:acetolactate synthase-1/2/3 large subunit
MKVSNFIVKFLVENNIRDIFLVAGGGIMHILDSVGTNPGMTYYCNYHEQACAISAETYARVSGKVGACLVTTGPGGTNALTGVAGAWVDSIPILVLSGQVRRDLIADYTKIRQRGPQEGNIVEMARPITKYATTVLDPQMIKYELEKALFLATTGRPGPVWLDIPLDVQASEIDETQLRGFDPPAIIDNDLKEQVRQFLGIVSGMRRPLFICGNGIHLGRAEDELDELLEKMPFPVVLPHAAKDLVPEDYPRYVGVFGTAGQRRANFAVQNADCIVSLASGLSVEKVGFNFNAFAPNAKKVFVDIDEGQLFHQAVKPDFAVKADIRDFLAEVLRQIDEGGLRFCPSPEWIDACAVWKKRYLPMSEKHETDKRHVSSYLFMDKLSDQLGADDILVTGNGIDAATYWQAFRVKPGQRTMITGNWGAMGWDLPAAVGACVAGRRRTICVTGDGSSQMNVQELMTMSHYHLPIKIFVFNNRGYTNIRTTQSKFFGRFVGADEESGVSNPDFSFLAAAYGLNYSFIRTNEAIEAGISHSLNMNGPSLCEVNISSAQEISPKSSSYRREDGTVASRSLEDMWPPLPPEEVWKNMHLFDGAEQ